MRSIIQSGVLAVLALSATPAATGAGDTAPASAAAWTPAAPVAGAYTLDKAHASLIFRVNHLGFSNYTARFRRFDAQLQFDPANLIASRVTATVDARSLETDFPDPAKLDFNAMLQNEQWLNTQQFPEMTYRSVTLELVGSNRLRIHGELTLHGVTRPVALDATYNGGYAGHPMDPHARIGFSAHGTIKRSEFGIAAGIPAPGSLMGVGDDVDIAIEAEFTGPALAAAAPGTR
jgi:polyisoprenoid-binding protein YceI